MKSSKSWRQIRAKFYVICLLAPFSTTRNIKDRSRVTGNLNFKQEKKFSVLFQQPINNLSLQNSNSKCFFQIVNHKCHWNDFALLTPFRSKWCKYAFSLVFSAFPVNGECLLNVAKKNGCVWQNYSKYLILVCSHLPSYQLLGLPCNRAFLLGSETNKTLVIVINAKIHSITNGDGPVAVDSSICQLEIVIQKVRIFVHSME